MAKPEADTEASLVQHMHTTTMQAHVPPPLMACAAPGQPPPPPSPPPLAHDHLCMSIFPLLHLQSFAGLEPIISQIAACLKDNLVVQQAHKAGLLVLLTQAVAEPHASWSDRSASSCRACHHQISIPTYMLHSRQACQII